MHQSKILQKSIEFFLQITYNINNGVKVSDNYRSHDLDPAYRPPRDIQIAYQAGLYCLPIVLLIVVLKHIRGGPEVM